MQFALGVGDFDLWKHQPHPPGYPLYIAAGWLAHHVLPLDVPNALQLVSALGGGLFVACWFVMIARRFGRFTAWVCTAALGDVAHHLDERDKGAYRSRRARGCSR